MLMRSLLNICNKGVRFYLKIRQTPLEPKLVEFLLTILFQMPGIIQGFYLFFKELLRHIIGQHLGSFFITATQIGCFTKLLYEDNK